VEQASEFEKNVTQKRKTDSVLGEEEEKKKEDG